MSMTPFQQLIHSRRSIRRYIPRPVERDKILACLDAARIAPSASNSQTWRFLVIDDPDLKTRFAKVAFSGIYANCRFAVEAPVLILITAKLDFVTHQLGKQIQGIPFFLIDIGISGEHLILQAEEFGLGTCWIGWFDMRKTRKFFKIPRTFKIVSLISMGYYEKRPPRDRVRKPLDEIAWFNRFDG